MLWAFYVLDDLKGGVGFSMMAYLSPQHSRSEFKANLGCTACRINSRSCSPPREVTGVHTKCMLALSAMDCERGRASTGRFQNADYGITKQCSESLTMFSCRVLGRPVEL